MKNLKGFVLIIVLLFLQIFTLLGLCALRAAWMEDKIIQNQAENYYIFHQIEQFLRQIAEQMQTQIPACLITPTLESELHNRPDSWWQAQCSAGNFQAIKYYYVLEPLGKDSCAHLRSPRGLIANYYRLTMMVFNHEERLAAQSTIIVPSHAESTCDSVIHQVEVGRQSWHELM